MTAFNEILHADASRPAPTQQPTKISRFQKSKMDAIKCIVTDNKTANINNKNCSLSIALTAMDQKLQKS